MSNSHMWLMAAILANEDYKTFPSTQNFIGQVKTTSQHLASVIL